MDEAGFEGELSAADGTARPRNCIVRAHQSEVNDSMRYRTIAAVMILAAAEAANGQNRVNNGSFEQALTGWTGGQVSSFTGGLVGTKAAQLGTNGNGCAGVKQQSPTLLDKGMNFVMFSFRPATTGNLVQVNLSAMMPQIVVGAKGPQPGTFYLENYSNEIAGSGNLRPLWVQVAAVFDLPNSKGGGEVTLECDPSVSDGVAVVDEVYAIPLTDHTPSVHGAAVRTGTVTNGSYEALWNGNASQGPLQVGSGGYLYFVAKAPQGKAWTLSMLANATAQAAGGPQPVMPAASIQFHNWTTKLWESGTKPPPVPWNGKVVTLPVGTMKTYSTVMDRNLSALTSQNGYVLGRIYISSSGVCGTKGTGCPPFDVRMKELRLQ